MQRMSSVPTIQRFLIGAGIALLAVGGQLLLRAGYAYAGAIGLVGGAFVFAYAFRSDPNTLYKLNINVSVWRLPREWLILGSIVVAAGLSIASLVLLDVYEPSQRFWTVYVLSIVTIVAAPIGVIVYDCIRGACRPSASWLWLLAILVLAAATRLVGLASLPFGTWYDEAANGLEALRILNEPQYKPVYTDGVNSSGHYLYMIVAAFRTFGVSTQSVRIISALAGVGTVAAAYIAGRELYGRSLGLALAFMLAISRWSINFSRLGMYNALTPFFEFLAVAFLLRALRRNRLEDYVLAGVSLGLGLCFYSAFQLFLVAVGVFLLYIILSEWRPGSRYWIGLVIVALSALIVVMPLIKFAYQRPESYFARVQNTSIFSDKQPEDRIPALLENARKHALMFNVKGDPNGRHNLPGEPMLDPITAALFVIGIALSLSRIRSPIPLFLLIWLVIGLMGGVLSLDFEAPQSLRSIATMPVVYILAVMPLYLLNTVWVTEGGRYTPHATMGFIALLLLPSATYNLDTYFRKQANDFATWNAYSTPETLAAGILNSLEPDTRAYVISLYNSHPTLRFLASDGVEYERLETTAALPIVDPSDASLSLILDADRYDLYQEALRLYPNAEHEEYRAPFGGPVVLYTVLASKEDRAAIQGFTGSYGSPVDPAQVVEHKDAVIDMVWPDDAPLESPFSVEWTGVLAAAAYGPYQFRLASPADAALYINETPVIENNADEDGHGSVILPRGLHQIRITADSGDGPMQLLWRTPNRETEVLPAWQIFSDPVTNNGLLGRYYTGGDWSGTPAMEQIDSGFDMYFHIPILPRPYTVEWSGMIAIPESGRYGFGVKSNDESELRIDGELIAASNGEAQYDEGSIDLEAGLHEIAIRYADRSDHTFFSAYWAPPPGAASQGRQIIPDEILFPPLGNYERIEMPEFSEFGSEPSSSVETDDRFITNPVVAETLVDGLHAPGGIAVVPDGVVVAIPEQSQVLVYGMDGKLDKILEHPQSEFVEPFDITVSEDGHVYVLDADAGEIVEYDGALGHPRILKLQPDQVNRARGIGAAGNDGLWIAQTPGGQLLYFDLAEESVRSVPANQHMASFGEAQPVDIAAMEDGSFFVTDAGVHKLSIYNDRAMRMWSIDIPVANTLNGSHLAPSGNGTVYMTVPEMGSVIEVDSSGGVIGSWTLQTDDGKNVKPVSIAVDDDGAIIVSDVDGGRLVRFYPTEMGNALQ